MSERDKYSKNKYGGVVPKEQHEVQNPNLNKSPTDSQSFEDSGKSDSHIYLIEYDTKGLGSSSDSDDSKNAVNLDNPEKNKTSTFLLTDTCDTQVKEGAGAKNEGFK